MTASFHSRCARLLLPLLVFLTACSGQPTSGGEDAEMNSGCLQALAQVAPEFGQLARLGQVVSREASPQAQRLSVRVGGATLHASLTCGSETSTKKKKSGKRTRRTTERYEVLNFEWDVQNAKDGSALDQIQSLTQKLERRVDSYDQT